jgi:Ca-activated chloride channel family protein
MKFHPEYLAATVLLLSALAEALHARRCRRLATVAFGPSGQARIWTRWVAAARVASMVFLAWGLATLLQLDGGVVKSLPVPEGGYRHLLVVLDVSPSMQLKDAGPTALQTRMQRANDLILSFFGRIALEQVRVSVIGFYTGAKPVVIDTSDVAVVKNIMNDLPLDQAFDIGKTTLFEGVREAGAMAKPWKAGSTTMLIISDGDTIPDTGLPTMPPAIGRVLVLGVGDARIGKFIDGHQSRQDAATLRQLANRLRGVYHDGNEKHLPSEHLAYLAQSLPLRDEARKGRREAALALTAVGGSILALAPVALALFGSPWQAGRQKAKNPVRQPESFLPVQ